MQIHLNIKILVSANFYIKHVNLVCLNYGCDMYKFLIISLIRLTDKELLEKTEIIHRGKKY